VNDSHGLAPQLEARGFAEDYAWMKFDRDLAPHAVATELRIERIGPDRADDFGAVVGDGFGMPPGLRPLVGGLVGRAGWTCFLSYDGDRPVGAGALFVDGDDGWLGVGATLEDARGRGSQGALIAARIRAAQKLGCRRVTTETGVVTADRPSASYRNILRAGFREAGVRPNYKAPF
jgi:GNAT superfamily N-acetyltransferase